MGIGLGWGGDRMLGSGTREVEEGELGILAFADGRVFECQVEVPDDNTVVGFEPTAGFSEVKRLTGDIEVAGLERGVVEERRRASGSVVADEAQAAVGDRLEEA